MFFIVPTGTDAPLYHWPFATGGVMLLNIVVLVLQYAFPEQAESFMLQFGTINPIQWISSWLMHAGPFHLIGNLIGLGLFGWIVEGKVGWWKFLLICCGIGIPAAAFTQLVMLLFVDEGAALGFSTVVFGLIAMSMVWAPENEIRLAAMGIFFFRPFCYSFEVTVSTLGFVMIGLQLLGAAFTGFVISSEVLHLIGSVPGFVIAYLMIRWRQVDCDGYDLVSTLKGKRGERVMTVADEKAEQVRAVGAKQTAKKQLVAGLKMVQSYVDAGHYELAIKRFDRIRNSHHGMKMTEAQYVKIIKAFDADESTKQKTVPLLKDYLQHYSQYKIPFTLMLARVYVLLQDRPRLGIKTLQTLEWKELNKSQQGFVRKLLDRAKQMIADGVLEVNE